MFNEALGDGVSRPQRKKEREEKLRDAGRAVVWGGGVSVSLSRLVVTAENVGAAVV